MATSTVARFLASGFLFVTLICAQSVSPTNGSITDIFTSLTLDGNSGPLLTQNIFRLAPLTGDVGLGQTQAAVSAFHPSGKFIAVGPSNEGNVTTGDLAYISCDPNTENSNIDPTSVVTTVGNLDPKPKGIILYSISSNTCNLTGTFPSQDIWTMTSFSDSMMVLRSIGSSNVNASVGPNTNSTSPGRGGSQTGSNNDGGPAPTTAVAMSILYSITGIITLLFLIIIGTGAIRAHRHPERYGPRTALAGRPRQSRAKGLARAMLETLPIVKFGDPEPAKPGSRDIELEDGNTSVHHTTEAAAVQATTERQAAGTSEVESGMGPAQAESIKSGNEATKKEGELGCSICTEDFTTGEDVRVLPCHHKYHPACIDPWLLNVSGTCPLCRHNLHPVASATDTAPDADSELPPPLSAVEEGIGANENDAASASPQRRRMSRFLDLNRLRHAPPDERIAALRRLREQEQAEPEAQTEPDEPGRRARLTARLRDGFRIRTRAQNDTTQE